MTVKLHKVTLFVISIGSGDEDGLDRLIGDCYHNGFCKIAEIQTAEFDREWDDDDPLNKRDTTENRAKLEALVEGKPSECLIILSAPIRPLYVCHPCPQRQR